MKIKLDLKKSLEENASDYFNIAKKSRGKIDSVKKIIEDFQRKHDREVKLQEEFKSNITKLNNNKNHWFEKFKWFVTSEGFLVIGARDATSNEIIIKKHTSEEDIVFHTDMAGSPFVVIKKNSHEDVKKLFGKNNPPNEIGIDSIKETATFCFTHSKAWKQGLSSTAVFWVKPDQVSKDANAGESLSKGAFVIRGKTNYVDYPLGYAVGLFSSDKKEPVFLSGPLNSLKHYVDEPIIIEQGKEKPSLVAKNIRSQIRAVSEVDVPLDLIVRNLPQGIQLKKIRKRKK